MEFFFFCRPPIITSSPSEDHTYSQGGVVRSTNTSDNNSNGTSSDAAYESCEERFVNFFLLFVTGLWINLFSGMYWSICVLVVISFMAKILPWDNSSRGKIIQGRIFSKKVVSGKKFFWENFSRE